MQSNVSDSKQQQESGDWRATAVTHWSPPIEPEVDWLDRFFRIFNTVVIGGIILGAITVILPSLLGHSGHGDSRRAEGEQLLGSARDFLRVEYSKMGSVDLIRERFADEIDAGAFTGQYFQISPDIEPAPIGATAHTSPTRESYEGDGTGSITWEWRSGNSTITWEP